MSSTIVSTKILQLLDFICRTSSVLNKDTFVQMCPVVWVSSQCTGFTWFHPLLVEKPCENLTNLPQTEPLTSSKWSFWFTAWHWWSFCERKYAITKQTHNFCFSFDLKTVQIWKEKHISLYCDNCYYLYCDFTEPDSVIFVAPFGSHSK